MESAVQANQSTQRITRHPVRVDVIPQPTASRIVMIRVPEADTAALEASNGYLDPGKTALSSDLAVLGLRVAAPAELDALLEGFLRAYRPSGYVKVGAEKYSRLAPAIDRLLIESAEDAGAQPLPARARRSSRDRVQLVSG
jgi:hypothetical protein